MVCGLLFGFSHLFYWVYVFFCKCFSLSLCFPLPNLFQVKPSDFLNWVLNSLFSYLLNFLLVQLDISLFLGSQYSDQWLNQSPLHWKPGVLTAAPSGKSYLLFFCKNIYSYSSRKFQLYITVLSTILTCFTFDPQTLFLYTFTVPSLPPSQLLFLLWFHKIYFLKVHI